MIENKKQEILLESGTNELEIIEFTIADRHFGINVAKATEIMQYQKVTPMPNSNQFIEGIFKPRSIIITVFNLPAYMGLPPSEDTSRDILIITNFNKVHCAFHVHSVDNIHRISWEDIEKVDTAIYGGAEGMATGIARVGDKLITIIDFEKILSDISPGSSILVEDVRKLGIRPINNKPILVVEDSQLLKKLIIESLHVAGFNNTIYCANGKEAWELLSKYKKSNLPIHKQVACVVTDIEMPQMDGHRLIKLIREDSELEILPVIIFSSLINEQMYLKGEQLGATAQITKPEITQMFELIDKHIL